MKGREATRQVTPSAFSTSTLKVGAKSNTNNNTLKPHSGTTKSSRSSPSSTHSPLTSSPSSVRTPGDSPPSPFQHKFTGPALLPKIRKQDQKLDQLNPSVRSSYGGDPPRSERHQNLSYGIACDPRFDFLDYNHQYRRSNSPVDYTLITPTSAYSNFTSSSDSSGYSPFQDYPIITSPGNHYPQPTGHARSVSAHQLNSYGPNHIQVKSKCTVDGDVIRRYAYPTRGQIPLYQVNNARATIGSGDVVPQQIFSVPAPRSLPPALSGTSSHHAPRGYLSTVSSVAPIQHSPLPAELLFENYAEQPEETTLNNYLTAPNPSPSLVRNTPQPNRNSDLHFWWDIRNLAAWTDFDMAAIHRIPGFGALLNMSIPSPALALPPRVKTQPETLNALHDMHATYFVPKVNAALKVALGLQHLQMISQKPTAHPGAPKLVPDFIANYPQGSSAGSTSSSSAAGTQQARVVGIVRAYDTWNSGMRSSNPSAKISYLRELAQLQFFMRSHGCRYGFILTEIELVCVRMGAQPSNVAPVYGLLELAEPVQLAAHGRPKTAPVDGAASSRYSGSGSTSSRATSSSSRAQSSPDSDSLSDKTNNLGGLTACLALWYLHMLAKNEPLPGQCSWRVDIGPPAARSRANIIAKDPGWMSSMRPEGREKRDAKRNRGWIMPEDPTSRKEAGKPKRWTKRMERERLEAQQRGSQ